MHGGQSSSGKGTEVQSNATSRSKCIPAICFSSVSVGRSFTVLRKRRADNGPASQPAHFAATDNAAAVVAIDGDFIYMRTGNLEITALNF